MVGVYTHLLSVIKYRTALVKQIIDAELDPRLDCPPQRPIVVIGHVIYDERIIGPQLKRWLDIRTPWIHVTRLKGEPDLLKRHPLGLIKLGDR